MLFNRNHDELAIFSCADIAWIKRQRIVDIMQGSHVVSRHMVRVPAEIVLGCVARIELNRTIMVRASFLGTVAFRDKRQHARCMLQRIEGQSQSRE